MKREIKFRAWDRTLDSMHEVEGFNDMLSSLSNSFNYVVAGGVRERKDVELMQYVGLTDKYGVEIYEGDIVNQNGDISVIEGCVGGFQVKVLRGLNADSTFLFQYLCKEVCQVIGNIYENPNLLTPNETN